MSERHRSAGEWLSWRSWSTHRPCGRPGRRFQSALEICWERGRPAASRAWWAAVEAGSLATWQKNRRPLRVFRCASLFSKCQTPNSKLRHNKKTNKQKKLQKRQVRLFGFFCLSIASIRSVHPMGGRSAMLDRNLRRGGVKIRDQPINRPTRNFPYQENH